MLTKKLLVLAMLGAFSAVIIAPAHACYYTPGYWKNHDWPVDVTLCGTVYDQSAGQALLRTPPKGGDLTIKLAHHLIAAKLNWELGARNAYSGDLIPNAEAALCAAGGVGGNPDKGSPERADCEYYLGLLDAANNTPW